MSKKLEDECENKINVQGTKANTVKVLGTTYIIIEDYDNLSSDNRDGACDMYNKLIVLKNCTDLQVPDEYPELQKERLREVVTHELVHAFLHESGLDCYNEDETIVDWFALELPKINKAVKEIMGDE